MSFRPRTKIRASRKGFGAKDSAADFETVWGILSSALTAIHSKNSSSLSFEEIYRNVYMLTLRKEGEKLHKKVCGFEGDWLENEVLPSLKATITPTLVVEEDRATDQANERRASGEQFFLKLKDVWEDYELCMGMVTDVLLYMDRAIEAAKILPSIYTASICLFRDKALLAPGTSSGKSVLSTFIDTALFMIRLERDGNQINRNLIRHCVGMLENLYETDEESSNLYQISFEPAFLHASEKFYTEEGQALASALDTPGFCRKALSRIHEEAERCQVTLLQQTTDKIHSAIDDCMLQPKLHEVNTTPSTGVDYMLSNDLTEDLHNLYTLNKRVDTKLESLSKAVKNHVISAGKEITGGPPPTDSIETNEKLSVISLQTAAAIKWVDDILKFRTEYEHFCLNSFDQDHVFQQTFMEAYKEVINSNSRSSEYLSLFFDENLKKGIKGKTEEEVDGLLDNGIILLRYIKDKDLFEDYYKKHLSRRLLKQRSVSMDAERQMISKMKMEVGTQFTQRLEAMFRDMSISADLTERYRSYSKGLEQETSSIDLNVSILTSTMWPMEMTVLGNNNAGGSSGNNNNNNNNNKKKACILPRRIESLRDSFESFYLSQHSGRVLSWQPAHGTADIRFSFTKPNGKIARYELNLSTFGMVILSLFNDFSPDVSLSFEEIESRTNIPRTHLIRNLQSLSVPPKTRILRKEPLTKEVSPTDIFYFNDKFQSKFTKIRVNVVSNAGNNVEGQTERKATEDKMNEQRGINIEAAIVRIMKQRKTLLHSKLMSEVISQLSSRFQPDVHLMKKRIDSLIDREYIERVPDSEPPAYSYLA